MNNFKVNVEKLEKLETPCHGCYFSAGLTVVGLIVLT